MWKVGHYSEDPVPVEYNTQAPRHTGSYQIQREGGALRAP